MCHRRKRSIVLPTFALLVSGIIAVSMLSVREAQGNESGETPVNVWRCATQSETGGRMSPMLVYLPEKKRFLLTGGVPERQGPRHYDNEEFDLAAGRWTNAVPADVPAIYRTASGPTGAPVHPKDDAARNARAMVDENGVPRIPMFGSAYSADSRAHFQYAYDLDSRRLFAYLWNKTLAYDPANCKWQDLEAHPSPAAHEGIVPAGHREMIWGSLCYDPVNREIISVGGTAATGGGTPGAWLYSIKNGSWRRGSVAVSSHQRELFVLRQEAWDLMSRLRNRLHGTETESEASKDLFARMKYLAGLLNTLAEVSTSSPVPGPAIITGMKEALLEHATDRGTAVTPETITSVERCHRAIDALIHAGAVEPPGRALSQMAYDAANEKIVLFGGDGLDRQYADTWVYDCRTRQWQQRFPATSPAPRAGHALLYLPRSKRILLVGGYGIADGHSYMYGDVYRNIPFEMWTYDTAENQWHLLVRLPLPKRGEDAPHTPPGDYRGTWPAAVDEDDVVVMVPGSGKGRETWVCRVDPTQIDEEGTRQFGVPPGTVAFRGDDPSTNKSYDPADYDGQQPFDAAAMEKALASIPANQWTHVVPPKPVDKCGWGTSTYDAQRQQILFWGGGHSEYKGTSVMHYSLRTNRWSISCRPDWCLEWSGGFLCPALVTFHNRPHVPVHAYQAYAYDPPSGRLVAVRDTTFTYDVANRRWEWPPVETPFHAGVMHVALETTPRGVIAWAGQGRYDEDTQFYRFDGQRRAWQKLPKTGPALREPWCDGSSLCYDAKRDCLWLAPADKLYRYDLNSGETTAIDTEVPEVLGRFALWREQVHLPDEDLILLMRLFPGPDGKLKNLAYDISANKYYWLDLPFVADGKLHDFQRDKPFSWSSALFYDADRKLVILHHPPNFWMLRLDRESARMTSVDQSQP